MEGVERIADAVGKAFDALYRPMVIALLCAISYQVGQLQ